jgi:hypothetical protein
MLAMGALTGAVRAADINVSGNIDGNPHPWSSPWTAGNVYHLKQQVYVLPGASLVIEPGAIVASNPVDAGSLAVCRGAQIFVLGTQENPVIMTSTNDMATWVGGNPKTGTWREAANEWGNLTVMGGAYISENAVGGNVPTPSASNVANMEGLTNGPSTDQYGGGNDDDDSGTIKYLSLRYGGKVVALAVELNGLSLGGLGRGTDIHHVDIMNNVDDGVEIWGGTVNLKYLNIWNIGDDCFDVDQGWRGKAQFGLLVQGYSLNAAQGSGVGDNCFETDGAEDSDWQPVTTASIYNFTVIGQPVDGDQGTAWRDNARVQYRNCIFMDLGEELVRLDNVDGDGAHGYGFNGTLSWADTWTTNFNAVPAHANDPANPSLFYKAQTSGKLAEITDSVFFRNLFATAYVTATAVGVLPATGANNNVLIPGVLDADAPIQSITRAAPVVKGGKTMVQVIGLDPRPKNQALTSVGTAPNDGFFTPFANYRGAFPPGQTWLSDWTASYAFGFTPAENQWTDLGFAKAGLKGDPELEGNGNLSAGSNTLLHLTNARPNSLAVLFVSFASFPAPFKGGILATLPLGLTVSFLTDANGTVPLAFPWPTLPAGFNLFFQYGIQDPAASFNVSLSNAQKATQP